MSDIKSERHFDRIDYYYHHYTVKKKFGEQSREAELFVLAPTTSTANPLLVGRFSGMLQKFIFS